MRSRKYSFEELPEPGEAYCFRLGSGEYGACRVIRRSSAKETRGLGSSILCAGCVWQGPGAPEADDPSLRRIATMVELRGSKEKVEPELIWISMPPPPEFTRVGIVEPDPDEAKLNSQVCGEWEMFLTQREDEEELSEEPTDNEAMTVTIAELLEQASLRGWEDGVPKSAAAAARRALRTTVRKVGELECADRQSAAKTAVLACIRKLNVIDANHGPFIGTIEREELCSIFYALLESAGVNNAADVVDAERDW